MVETRTRTTGAGRLPGGILVCAAAIALTGAAIGFLAPSLREAPWSDDLQLLAATIARNPTAFAWANGLFLAAALLTALGLVPVSMQFEGHGRAWSLSGLVAFIFAAVFEAIDRIISMQVYTWAAQQNVNISDFAVQSFILFADGLGMVFYILGFLALAFFGVAMFWRTGAKGLRWLFVSGGILGMFLSVVGAIIPAFVYFGTAALGIATWRLK